MKHITSIKTIAVISLFLLAGSLAAVANANHAWGKYHWNKSTDDTTTNPLVLSDNLDTANWNSALLAASTDWNLSVLKNEVAPGTSNANCDDNRY